MTVAELHKITSKLIAQKRGHIDVSINYASFTEHETATILPVEKARKVRVQGADDSGPVGPKFPFLVLYGDSSG